MLTYEQVLANLAEHRPLDREQTRMLSGLASRELRELRPVWSGLSDPERMRLLATLRRYAEEDVLVDFDAIFEMATEDPNSDVRRLAVVAAVDDERPEMMARLLWLCTHDADEMVRGAAAERLAGFAYRAEVGELSVADAREIERVLLDRVRSETEAPNVRAAALASVGYFSTEAVRAALRRGLTQESLQLAAIQAIGRNCDSIWTADLIERMASEDPALRREAAEAAADYQDTVEALAALVDDPVTSVRLAAIASLGSIGGPEAREILVYCYESSDSALQAAAATALRQIDETEDALGTAGMDWHDEDSEEEESG